MVELPLPYFIEDLISQRDLGHSKTILHWAADSGHETVVKHCLDLRTDIHVKDKYGEPALHYAAENGRPNVVRTLVSAGSNLHALDDRIGPGLTASLIRWPSSI